MKLIIDVDTGCDDAQAIMMAIAQPDVEILAITCVNGNVKIDQVCRNTLSVLQVCDRLDIPVYKGASAPLVQDVQDPTGFYGWDGLGDTDIDHIRQVDKGLIREEHAVVALINLVNKYPGEITLAALAPFTNIALALRLDPTFGSKLKRLLIMGGNIEGKGNFTVSGEFNVAIDPEAASIVLGDAQCPVTLVSWETCLDHSMDWEWYEEWIKTDTEKGRFNKAITAHPAGEMRNVRKASKYTSCDLTAMISILHEDAIIESQKCYCTVELHGRYTRGQMVVDWRGMIGKEPNVEIVRKIDKGILQKFMDDIVK